MLRKGTERSNARRRALRLRRRLGLAPRGITLLACAAVLVAGTGAAYGATVPALASARGERIPHVARRAKTVLGSTTGYVWASILDSALFGTGEASGSEGATQTVTLADGKTIVLTNVRNVTRLTNANVNTLAAKAEEKAAEKAEGKQDAGGSTSSKGDGASGGSGSDSSSGSNSGSNQGGSGSGSSGDQSGSGSGSSGGSSGGSSSDTRPKPTEAEEAQMHDWLVAKANALNGYVASVNAAVSTYNATGDISTCDNLANELFYIRCEFGRQTFSPRSVWYSQFANLWGAYTNLDIYVGRYGEDQDALATFNAKVAAINL